MAAIDWSDTEVELIVADYLSMLKDELVGIKVNKTLHRKNILPLLYHRSDGSVEFKHQNISAVLAEMGLPFIEGYKPRLNFQRSKLLFHVQKYIDTDKTLESLLVRFAEYVPQINHSIDFYSWEVQPPINTGLTRTPSTSRRARKINYLEQEQNNRQLGLKGEELAICFEKHRLVIAGKDKLADQVEWVAKELGDGLGFDILSRNLNGTDKFIEVKTTKLSKDSPFYFTSNELRFSIENEKNFHLYRIFDLGTKPGIFTLHGNYNGFCQVEPVSYIGRF